MLRTKESIRIIAWHVRAIFTFFRGESTLGKVASALFHLSLSLSLPLRAPLFLFFLCHLSLSLSLSLSRSLSPGPLCSVVTSPSSFEIPNLSNFNRKRNKMRVEYAYLGVKFSIDRHTAFYYTTRPGKAWLTPCHWVLAFWIDFDSTLNAFWTGCGQLIDDYCRNKLNKYA